MITDIVFYEDTCWGKIGIYDEDKKDEMISSIKQQFINTKLDDLSAKGKNVIILCQEKLLDEDHPDKMLSTVDILPSVRSDLTAAARVIGMLCAEQ